MGGEAQTSRELIDDPIRFEVIRNSLKAAVEQMSAALAKSAYSTNIKTRLDFSCAIFQKDMRVVCQAFNQPTHLGLLAFSVPATLKEYGVGNLGPGDGILINDPHRGMSHLNDVCLISPIYHLDELWGYVANLAHHVDVGGRAPGSLAVTTEIYQEGLIIPGVKILKKNEIDPDTLKFVLANVRGKKETSGDLRAQVASNKLAQRRISELLEKFGVSTVNETIEQLYLYTERRYRSAVKELREGEYFGDSYIDDDGISSQPIKIKVKVTIKEDEIIVDFTGSDMQRGGPMNCTYSMTLSSSAYPIKALLPSDLPVNDAFYKRLNVIAPKGSVVNCVFPSAVVGGWEVGLKATEAIFRAFAQAMPDKIPAEGKKTIYQVAFGGIDPRDGERYVFYETIAGGYGARPDRDGPDAVQAHQQNTENSPVEELEGAYPVLILRYELIEDSGGAGKFRGGLGIRRDYMFRSDATVTILADTAVYAPRGMFTGHEGSLSRFILNPGTASQVQLASKSTFPVKENAVISFQTPGGGGYGDLRERDPGLIAEDIRSGKVSPTNKESDGREGTRNDAVRTL